MAPATKSGPPKAKARRCCSWRMLCGIPLLAVLVAIIAACVPLISKYRTLAHDEQFAFIKTHQAIVKPPALHARYRMSEYANLDVYFFQWWNFLVFDSQTRHHYNIIYHLTNFSSASNNMDTASVSMGHLESSTRLNAATDTVPLEAATVTRYADVHITITDEQGNKVTPYTMTFDDDTINIKAAFPASKSTANLQTEWDITFSRIHGVYMGIGSEESNKASRDMCLLVSNLFAYNSFATGYVSENGVKHEFDTSDRYRAYAAGSWGCQLPSGNPPVNYPWTWFWIVIPNALPSTVTSTSSSPYLSDATRDLSMVFGTAKFQSPLLQDLYGTFAITGLGDTDIISSQSVRIFHNTSMEMGLIASSSDKYVSTYTVEFDEWSEYTDEYGKAILPLIQKYFVKTRCYAFDVIFESKIEQYFRAPVSIEKELKLRVFSDFRAVGVTTHVTVNRRAQCIENAANGGDELVYKGTIDTMNALEFAYEPDMDIEKWSKFSGVIPK